MAKQKKQLELSISDFCESFFMLAGKPFSLADYPHMRTIYNSDANKIVMKFSRQCVVDSQPIHLADGSSKLASQLKKGDALLGFNTQTLKNSVTNIVNIWDNGRAESYKITTSSGHSCMVTHNHPIWTTTGWKNAEDLTTGDRVGVTWNNSCALPQDRIVADEEVSHASRWSQSIDYKVISNLTRMQLINFIFLWWKAFKPQELEHRTYDVFSASNASLLQQMLLRLAISSKLRPDVHPGVLEITSSTFENVLDPYDLGFDWDVKHNHKNVHEDSDHIFEYVSKIESLGEQKSLNIETESVHTFFIDNILVSNTAKSTTLANLMLARAFMSNNFKQLYVSPAVAQTQEFSRDKLEPVIKNSEVISEFFVDSTNVQNVLKKEFLNGSVINLRYALLTADRIRGISADVNYFDECFSPNMEILTKSGWVSVTKATMDAEYATVSPDTLEVQFQAPQRVIAKDYHGGMYKFSDGLEVTENHNIFVSYGANSKTFAGGNNSDHPWELAPAREVMHSKKDFRMMYAPKPKRYLKNEDIEIGEVKLPERSYAAIVGLIVRSGVISDNKLIAFSLNGKEYKQFSRHYPFEFLRTKPLTSTDTEDTVVYLKDKEVVRHFSGLHKHQIIRRIVHDYPHLARRVANFIFRDHRYGTGNNLIADALQELLFVSGYDSVVTIKGHLYEVRRRKVNQKLFTHGLIRPAEVSLYEGKVYCVTVPNGTVVVRNKHTKKVFVSGNCQDLKKDVIGVTEETMSRSMVKKSVYVGTPKRTKGTLADFWFGSTQNEYAVKSSHSGYWNILGPDNIGLNGLIDKKSGMPLDLSQDKGEWVSTYSHTKDRPPMEGFRVCLLHFAHSPWVDWQRDVIYKMENHSAALFHNETLGLEYDSGSSPITKEEIIRACNPNQPMVEEPRPGDTAQLTIMGIDYGPVNSDSSYTCVSIVQENAGKFQVKYAKKFTGKEADYSFIHEEVPKLFKKWNCTILASDYGMGEAPNSEFRKRLGVEKVFPFQHLPTQKEPMRYNPKMKAYTLNKTFVMNRFFKMVKSGRLLFPKWEDFEVMSSDISNVIIDYNEEKNTEKFTNIGPDDFVHATLFATLGLVSLSSNFYEDFT